MFTVGGTDDEAALRAFYDSVAPLLVRIAYRIAGSEEAAEDLVHEAFIRFLEKRIPFPSADDAKYWLIRVVKNGALNYAKRKGREARAYERWWRGEAAVESMRSQTPPAEEELVRRESEEEIKLLLDRLPEKHRSVLVLKEYGGMSYKEIGRVLGISEGNVKVRAFRAREALLALLEQGDGHVPR